MSNFEELNRQTREYNSCCHTPPSQSTSAITGTQRTYNGYWQNFYNNQTYKKNNGEYSRKYY